MRRVFAATGLCAALGWICSAHVLLDVQALLASACTKGSHCRGLMSATSCELCRAIRSTLTGYQLPVSIRPRKAAALIGGFLKHDRPVVSENRTCLDFPQGQALAIFFASQGDINMRMDALHAWFIRSSNVYPWPRWILTFASRGACCVSFYNCWTEFFYALRASLRVLRHQISLHQRKWTSAVSRRTHSLLRCTLICNKPWKDLAGKSKGNQKDDHRQATSPLTQKMVFMRLTLLNRVVNRFARHSE